MEENRDLEKICFICLTSNEPIIPFKDDTFEKCKYSLAVRVKNNLKDNDKKIPRDINDISFGYHGACYRSFNAIGKKYKDLYDEAAASERAIGTPQDSEGPEIEESTANEPLPGCSSERVPSPSPALSDKENNEEDDEDANLEADEFNEKCIFCEKKFKKYKGRQIRVSTTANYNSMDGIKECGTKINDIHLLSKIHDAKTKSNNIVYHRICKTLYTVRAKKLLNTKYTEWHKIRNMHSAALQKLCIFIWENVVIKKKCFLVSFLKQLFGDFLVEEYDGTEVVDANIFHKKHIVKKIFSLKMFKNKIRSLRCRGVSIVAPYDVREIDDIHELLDESALRTTAMKLRTLILKIEKRKLPQQITTEDLITGECTIPEFLTIFLQTVLSGPNYRRKKSLKTDLRVNSIASDLIYATTNANIMPSKHITLGMTLKSLTSSKKVLTLINKLGHCISYNVLEELETEASYTSVSRSGLCPSNVVLKNDLHTGVAFDNFDRFVETVHGKDTLHDTVGIIYQDVCTDIEDNRVVDVVTTHTKKRRRTFDTIIPDIEPFTKRLKSIGGLLPVAFSSRNEIPSKLNEYKILDAAWMISHFQQIKTPMWVGFNAQLINDSSTKQIVSYLPTINASPTDAGVVVETMKRAIRIANECNQNYIQVTYDLAIAKIALQVQSMHWDEYSRLFIHLGPFHTEMSFLKAVGSFISNCGLTNVMVDSGLLAAGSVGGFLSAKNFNRAKRLHVLVSLALNMEHFKFFIESEDVTIDDSITTYLRSLQSHGLTDGFIDHAHLREVIEKYEYFKGETLTGKHGKTAQYYMTYTNMINNFLMLNRSVRTGDFSLLKYILPKINNLLFPMNHVNYARWLLRYHDNLLKVEDTHPGLSKELAAGYFGIKRTDKSFSRQPIDLVTEQTINADAGRTLTGITHFTNSIQARIRWTVNYAIRSRICSFLLDNVGLTNKPGITNDWKANRINKCRTQIGDFINGLNLRVNPFDSSLQKDLLYNISSGESAPSEVADFLLSIERTGDEVRKNFINDCAGDESNFSAAVIKRTKIQNFDTIVKKKKMQVGDKIKEIKVQKDLFGRLLAISMEEKVDIAKVLTFPLTPVPLSMCHIDGSLHKTNKAVLTNELERTVNEHSEPDVINITIYDGFAIFHSMMQVPGTFGKIVLKYLSTVCSSSASRIDVIFDEYRKPSIKEPEHIIRNSLSSDFTINGSEQIRPSNFRNEMRNEKFKTALVSFLIQHWTSDAAAEIIGTRVVHVNFEKCYKYVVNDGHVIRTVQDDLSCTGHEEADTKIIYHLYHIESESNVVIRCSDTDVLVIMLAHMCYLSRELHIWMDFGTGNTRRFINVNKIYDTLGEKVCRSLPGFHALTGCDYNPCFHRKGKKRALQIMIKSDKYQEAFLNIFNETEESFTILEEFICRLYNHRNVDEVNEVRLSLFFKSYSISSTGDKFMKHIKNFDASLLPPCKAELRQQLLRVLYISSVWCNAHLKDPSLYSPCDYGWKLSDEKYNFHWFDGNAMPITIGDIVSNGDNEEEEHDTEVTDISSNEEDESEDEVADDSTGDIDTDSEAAFS